MLTSIRSLSRGGLFAKCLSISHMKVIKLFNQLVTTIVATYTVEELDIFTERFDKTIVEIVQTFSVPGQGVGNSLYSALLTLKVIYHTRPNLLDKMLQPLIKVIQRAAKEHIALPQANHNPGLMIEPPSECGLIGLILFVITEPFIRWELIISCWKLKSKRRPSL